MGLCTAIHITPRHVPFSQWSSSPRLVGGLAADGVPTIIPSSGWTNVLGRLGRRWPHLYAVNIDDFSSNTGTFRKSLMDAMNAGLGGAVRLVPTFYFGSHGFVLGELPWLGNATDGVLFYFRNERAGQAQCSAGCSVPPNCTMSCLSGTCADRSVRNLPAEVADFAAALPPAHPIHLGIYFTGYSNCDAPSATYDREALSAALALPSVHGATIYVTQRPTEGCTAASGGGGGVGDGGDKGCIVREVFGGWNRTAAARAYTPACPAVYPFLRPAPGAAGTEAAPELCCGAVGDFATSCGTAGCCISSGVTGCPAALPACTCPADRPFEYGSMDGGTFCCGSRAGLPIHCSGGGECCLRPGAKNGCQGRPFCRHSTSTG